MEGYFGNNNDFNYAFPPLNLSNDNTPPLASPRVYDSAPRVRRYDESAMLRYLFSGSSSSDDNTTPRNRSSSVNQPHRLSRSSSGGCSSLRGSPLSSLENAEKFPRRRSEMAVKIEEDVLVMDAIPARSVARASGGSRSGRKREICRSWEEFGSCLYGPKCMFAHGKEDIHPRIITQPKSEMVHNKENIDPPIIRNPKSEFAHSEEEIDPRIFTKLKSEMAHNMKNIDPRIIRKPKSEVSDGKENIDPRIIIRPAANLEVNVSKSLSIATPKYEQKNPSTEKVPTKSKSDLKQKEEEQNRESSSDLVDDGIEVRLPYAVLKALYEPSPLRKRLPIFEEICPSETT